MPHMHGAEKSRASEPQPPVAAVDAHEHHHHSHSGRAHIHGGHHSSVPATPEPTPVEHDSDAVYVPDVVVDRTDTTSLQLSLTGWMASLPSLVEPLDLTALGAVESGVPDACALPQEHCALYLKLRTLRI